MPELPEVETVRQGLVDHVVGRQVARVEVYREYSVRRHVGGASALVEQLTGATFVAAVRRGKFLWLPLASASGAPYSALVAHLGMSGQLLVRDHRAPGPHVRVRIDLAETVLDFVDQRTFGYVCVESLAATADGDLGGLGSPECTVPTSAQAIARDLLDPHRDIDALAGEIGRRHTSIKRALLNQQLVSGVGNIYADEALWRARVHGERPTDRMRQSTVRRVLDAAAEVMTEALAQGGTSFDALYVNVNGASGYFSRSLAVYGRAGEPCARCATAIRREAFMNRSSFFCPRCQPRPRPPRGLAAY